MTPGEWIGLGTSVFLAGVAIWRQLKVKNYRGALEAAVDGIEQFAAKNRDGGKAAKVAVQARAVASGIEPFLSSFVKDKTVPKAKATNGGRAAAALLALVGLSLAAAACATPTAGQSEAPAWGQGIQVPVVQVYVGAPLPQLVDAKGQPVSPISILITNAGSGTTSPASTANQTAATSTSPTLSVPAGGGVGLPVKLGGGGPVKLPEVPAPPVPPEPAPPPAPVEPPR